MSRFYLQPTLLAQSGLLTFLAQMTPQVKPFKTFQQQAQLLLSRGMTSASTHSDQHLAEQIAKDLSFINYYRMSAYWYAYRKKTADGKYTNQFKSNTYWETIRNLYMFDRRLRSILFDAISRIEIALRTQLAHHWAKDTGSSTPQNDTRCYNSAFCTSKQSTNSKQRKKSRYEVLLEKVNKYYNSANDDVSKHHLEVYGITQAENLPIWVFIEYTTFGNLAALLADGLFPKTVETIAQNFGFSNSSIFISTINLLNDVRNICAHQGRLWNRYWLTPKGAHFLKNPAPCFSEWNFSFDAERNRWQKEPIQNRRERLHHNNYQTAAVLTMCNILLKSAASRSKWSQRLKKLLSEDLAPLPDIYRYIGFTNSNWHTHPLWL